MKWYFHLITQNAHLLLLSSAVDQTMQLIWCDFNDKWVANRITGGIETTDGVPVRTRGRREVYFSSSYTSWQLHICHPHFEKRDVLNYCRSSEFQYFLD